MKANDVHLDTEKKDSKFVRFLQYLLPTSFTIAMTGIICWIGSLIFLSRKLDDVPSASMAISIIAIPVFLVLLCVFWYVFLGIIRNQEEEEEPTEAPDEQGDNLKEGE